VAIELWRDPINWLLLAFTAFIVNIRHVLMGASLSRHMNAIPRKWHPLLMYMMADENWALSERRAGVTRLTPTYYFTMIALFYTNWLVWSTAGAFIGPAGDRLTKVMREDRVRHFMWKNAVFEALSFAFDLHLLANVGDRQYRRHRGRLRRHRGPWRRLGRLRRHERYPAPSASADVGKNWTCSRFGRRTGQLGRQ
jgi:hypothetical protein